MNVKSWYEKRGLKFVYQRGLALLDRYGLSSRKAFRRIEACLETLAASGCAPTFPTPGYVVERYPTLIQQIQKSGAEIAVHSYHHIDLSELPFNDAIKQLTRAVETFERFGIEAHGFRCPYMGCNDELLNSLPAGMFDYSSNRAIRWEPANMPASVSLFYETLHDFYHGSSAAETVCVP
ncbi:MAG: polysaccharide deacetylase family protein, partial [Anaerolineales bacterium]|nr:polysaccharide deacetylase family protein [Anaerolineales bacterium]